jgi:hypothetical protein
MSGQRRALVIGANGALGGVVAKAFGEAGWQVEGGARRPTTGQRLVDLDALEAIPAAIEDVDLILNTVPDTGLAAERAVLECGGRIFNLSAMPVAAGRALREKVSDAQGLVVLNAGLFPGLTSIVAGDLVRSHPDADRIEVAVTFDPAATSGPSGGAYAHRNLTTRSRHRTISVPFPPPFGEQQAIEFAEPERAWLGACADGREARALAYFTDSKVHRPFLALNRVGLMKTIPRAPILRGAEKAPKSATNEPVAIWIAISRQERRRAARALSLNGDYRATAEISVAMAEALLKRAGTESGCYDAEDLFTLDAIIRDLPSIGIELRDGAL